MRMREYHQPTEKRGKHTTAFVVGEFDWAEEMRRLSAAILFWFVVYISIWGEAKQRQSNERRSSCCISSRGIPTNHNGRGFFCMPFCGHISIFAPQSNNWMFLYNNPIHLHQIRPLSLGGSENINAITTFGERGGISVQVCMWVAMGVLECLWWVWFASEMEYGYFCVRVFQLNCCCIVFFIF